MKKFFISVFLLMSIVSQVAIASKAEPIIVIPRNSKAALRFLLDNVLDHIETLNQKSPSQKEVSKLARECLQFSYLMREDTAVTAKNFRSLLKSAGGNEDDFLCELDGTPRTYGELLDKCEAYQAKAQNFYKYNQSLLDDLKNIKTPKELSAIYSELRENALSF